MFNDIPEVPEVPDIEEPGIEDIIDRLREQKDIEDEQERN